MAVEKLIKRLFLPLRSVVDIDVCPPTLPRPIALINKAERRRMLGDILVNGESEMERWSGNR